MRHDSPPARTLAVAPDNHEQATMSRAVYEIRVAGSIGPAARLAFVDLEVNVEPTATTISGSLEQEDLHALLEQVRGLGLELLDLRRTPS